MPTSAPLHIFSGKRVLVTGHTGFKGAWLCEWLLALGAEVFGLALEPSEPSLFATLNLSQRMQHRVLDILEAEALKDALGQIQPDFVFHLAAQALVRASYREPILTFATNVLGTANVLESLRVVDRPCTVVVVTTDKCYQNDGRPHRFRESDPLGGHDPYSASKAAAELVVASYRDSFFAQNGNGILIASARAGNVVGGGDWAQDRLVPDGVRALSAGQPFPVRNPDFTRPWQHVLEPLGGYLLLGAKLEEARQENSPEKMIRYAQAFNFGPEPDANRSVRDLVTEILRQWPGTWEQAPQEKHWPEAPLLSLDITKAKEVLDWHPRWSFAETIAQTVVWYREHLARGTEGRNTGPMVEFTRAQIAQYTRSW